MRASRCCRLPFGGPTQPPLKVSSSLLDVLGTNRELRKDMRVWGIFRNPRDPSKNIVYTDKPNWWSGIDNVQAI